MKTNDELAVDIVIYFLNAGAKVSRADYDFVLNILIQKGPGGHERGYYDGQKNEFHNQQGSIQEAVPRGSGLWRL